MKEDFGFYIKNTSGIPPNGQIIISDDLIIESLVLFPNKISSITADIRGKLASFDFDDEILKVFIYFFTKLELINENDLRERLSNQQFDPISISFMSSPVIISGMVFVCEMLEKEESVRTNEQFIPLKIKSLGNIENASFKLLSQVR